VDLYIHSPIRLHGVVLNWNRFTYMRLQILLAQNNVFYLKYGGMFEERLWFTNQAYCRYTGAVDKTTNQITFNKAYQNKLKCQWFNLIKLTKTNVNGLIHFIIIQPYNRMKKKTCKCASLTTNCSLPLSPYSTTRTAFSNTALAQVLTCICRQYETLLRLSVKIIYDYLKIIARNFWKMLVFHFPLNSSETSLSS
jgi:hypothetical protein